MTSPLVVLLIVAAAPTAALVAAPTAALAQDGGRAAPAEGHARLVYDPADAVAACPTADGFRAAVNARAGRELFGEPAVTTIDVTLHHEGNGYLAIVDLPDADRTKRATRQLRSSVGCTEVAAAAALVVSLALDPTSILRAPPPPPAPAPVETRRRFAIGAGPRGVWGLVPAVAGGLALSALARTDRAALGVEILGLVSPDAKYAAGAVSFLPLALSAVPCRTWKHAEACGVGTLVALRGGGAGFGEDYSAWRFMAGVGARGAVARDVGNARLRLFVEGDTFLPRTTFLVDEGTAWKTRGVSFLAGVDVLFFFE